MRAVGASGVVPEVSPANVPVRRESPPHVPTSFECLSGWSCFPFIHACVRDASQVYFLVYKSAVFSDTASTSVLFPSLKAPPGNTHLPGLPWPFMEVPSPGSQEATSGSFFSNFKGWCTLPCFLPCRFFFLFLFKVCLPLLQIYGIT